MALIFVRWLTPIQLSSLGSSWVIKSGFMTVIWRQNNSGSNGRVLSHQDQRRHGTSGVQHKAMLVVVFHFRTDVHQDFVPSDSSVNSDFYCDVLMMHVKDLQRKGPELAQPQFSAAPRQRHLFHTSLKSRQFFFL